MREADLYRQLLGLEPPRNSDAAELAVKAQRVDAWAGHAEGGWPCSECVTQLTLHDHVEERSRRLLNSCQSQTYRQEPPRFMMRHV